MNTVRVLAALAVASLGAAGVAASACSADVRAGPPASAATAPAPGAASPPPAMLAAVVPAGQAAPLELESFAPLLADPRLREASAHVDAKDFAAAARAVDAALTAGQFDAALAPSYRLLLGRLWLDTDPERARLSFEASAAASWPLSAYAAAGAGRALSRLGRHAEALAWYDRVPAGTPLAADVALDVAAVKAKSGDRAGAIDAFRKHLAARPPTLATAGPSLDLAEELLSAGAALPEGDLARAAFGDEALTVARRVLSLAPPDEEPLARAKAAETRALSLLPAAERTARAVPSPAELLDRLRALTESRQYENARIIGEELLVRLGPKGKNTADGCEAQLLYGRAVAGTKEWGKAADLLNDSVRRCEDPDLRARALFLAGKYADSDKRWAEAVRTYERIEKEYPKHRLADDARLRAAQSYLSLGAEGRFTELLTRMPDDYPDGDMVPDGLFELAMQRIRKGDWSAAIAVLERASAVAAPVDTSRGQELAGRERYFLSRARAEGGDPAPALDGYEAIVRDVPLSYYMLHAYARLFAADAPRARRTMAETIARAGRAPFTFEWTRDFEHPGFIRALELLRVGDAESARVELEAVGMVGPTVAPAILWGVALLYDRAGSVRFSHALARSALTDWLSRWPSGDWRRAWQAAFPRPFAQLVQREASKNGVPEPLVYAVMREESAFDPDAESPAKAYGLMQLIEPTARRYGKAIGLSGDPVSLRRPSVNVAIGCRMLGDLTRSFSENALLAIPGYNAGPGRPRNWAKARPEQDFDLWVESIPFTETRRYTKRVLASRATYAFLYAPDQAEPALLLPRTVLPP